MWVFAMHCRGSLFCFMQKFCSTSKCHSSIHILLYFPFDPLLLAGMPTHSLQHQITSHAISLTILWPEYLAHVSASSLNLPSTLLTLFFHLLMEMRPLVYCVHFWFKPYTLFFHKFQSNFLPFCIFLGVVSPRNTRARNSSQLLSL